MKPLSKVEKGNGGAAHVCVNMTRPWGHFFLLRGSQAKSIVRAYHMLLCKDDNTLIQNAKAWEYKKQLYVETLRNTAQHCVFSPSAWTFTTKLWELWGSCYYLFLYIDVATPAHKHLHPMKPEPSSPLHSYQHHRHVVWQSGAWSLTCTDSANYSPSI